MFVMNTPAEEQKDRQQQYSLMESILKQQQKQKNQQDQLVVQAEDEVQKVEGKRKVSKSKPKGKQKAQQKKQGKKMNMTTIITKKTQIQKALKDFIPQGIRIQNQKRPSQEQYSLMQKASDVQQFSLNFKTFLGKILKVTDGDTLKIAFKLTNNLTRFSFRLNGVDTPESRSGEVKQFGQYVKQLLRRMLQGKIVRVEAGQFDKYGRVLSRIFAYSNNEQFCVNDFLLQNDLAKPYQGKTKNQYTAKDYQSFKKKYWRTSWPQVVHYPRIYFKGNSQN